MKKAKKLLKSHRFVAVLLCLCMIISMFREGGIIVTATEETKTAKTSSVTNGAVRQADPSTMDTYKKVLDFSENTRYAGRLWSDKSVFAYGFGDTGNRKNEWDSTNNTLMLTKELDGVDAEIKLDADFLHVYSVLGSSVQVNESVPVDLVLALDISGSMNSPEANEGTDWINTADPKDASTFSQGLGFYKGSDDNINSENGVVKTVQNGYIGCERDDNGIPDAIVPVLPEASQINEDGSGQMQSDTFTNYNEYLKFCNTLANVLESVYNDASITTDKATSIKIKLKEATDYLTNAKIDAIDSEKYQKIYDVYKTYKDAAFKEVESKRDPWLSYNTNNYVRNAMWPNAAWEDAMAAIEVKVNNPMKNASNAPNRMYYMINAANSFIEQYLSLNVKNRISVVVYDSVATVLMPLAHYDKAPNTEGYLTAQKHHWQTWGEGQWACIVTATAKPAGKYNEAIFGQNLKDGIYSASVTSWSNTGTVIALNAGMNILSSSEDDYSDLEERIPVMILMTDGAANVAMTGWNATKTPTEESVTFEKAWTQGANKGTTGEIGEVFNGYENLSIKAGHNYKLLTDKGFPDETSPGLTVYGANYGHIYGSEDDANTRYTVVLNTLMSTAYQKTLVEKHYNATEGNENPTYPGNEEGQEWTKANIYTIGFGLNYYSESTQGICEEILNPKENFKEDHKVAPGTSQNFADAFKNMFNGYTTWKNQTDGEYTQSFEKAGGTSIIDGSSSISKLTLKFPITQDDLKDTGVTKDDIDRNIGYNTEYYSAVLEGKGDDNNKTLGMVFSEILGLIENEMFTPVSGSNDLGVDDSVTYMDPIGKYMEVKNVTNLLLFGKLHDVVKTAVYDYSFITTYEKIGTFKNGWYKINENGTIQQEIDATKHSWGEEGWVYYVDSETAKTFLPTETTSNDEITSKMQNTTYTIYRLAEEGRGEPHINPAYGKEEGTVDVNAPGAYRLSDLRIWVEDTGDYSDSNLEGSGIGSDTNFDQALYVNIPVNMIPLRTVILTPTTEGVYTYTTNLPKEAGGEAADNSYLASFPLRVFYTVGVEESILTADRKVNVAGGISAEYLNENRVNTEATKAGRGLEIGDLEFFSNWNNQLNRYTAYAVTSNDYTYGDPVVSFSPSADNRYYVFEKSLPVYSKAYVWVPNTLDENQNKEYLSNEGIWEPVVITEELPTGDNEFKPTSFGGNLLFSNLNVSEVADNNILQKSIWDALGTEKISSAKAGDIILLENALIKDASNVNRDGANKDFTSTDYYYIALEYFKLNGNNNAKKIQYVVTRKGSEFGSAYAAAGLSNGELLCWYDASGKYNQIYPYLSRTETEEETRGQKYIGYNNIYNGSILKDINDFSEGEQSAAQNIQKNGKWVVAAKIGGLRVGDLAQDVRSKGEKYTEYDNAFISERYKEYKHLTWHCYEKNITRTANNYYVPTISTANSNSESDAAAAAAIVNTYLGNNGRLWIPVSTSLSLTKTVMVEGSEKPNSINETEFNYQVFIDGFTGARDANVLRYNTASNSWQYQLHYIDLELDGKLFLQTKDGQKAMVDGEGKLLAVSADGGYTYVDDGKKYDGIVYYVYIGTNGYSEATISTTAMRVYHNKLVDNYSISEDVINVDYYDENGEKVNDVDESNYNGRRKLYAASVYLIPVDQYARFSSPTDDMKQIKRFELLTVESNNTKATNNSAEIVINSRYRTSSSYWTETLTFGCNVEELYDQNVFGENTDLSKIAANTAETTLKNGYGLLFVGMDANTSYRFTEKLTNNNIDFYSFDHVDHIGNGGVKKSYGLNSIDAENVVKFQKENYVYSVIGKTDGSYEQSGHYYNRWNTGKTETQINGKDITAPKDDSNIYPGVKVGDTITYEIKWVNNTGKEADVVILDPLDKGVDFKDAYIGNNKDAKGKYYDTKENATEKEGVKVTTDRTVVWNLGKQAKDVSGTVTLIVTVNDDAIEYWDYDQDGTGGELVKDFKVRNRATVRVAENEYNTNTVVNPISQHSKKETDIERGEQANKLGQEKLELGNYSFIEGNGKLYGPVVYVGDRITYEIEWQNYKNEEATVTIRDPLDRNVKFISAEYNSNDTEGINDSEGINVAVKLNAEEFDETETSVGTTNDYGDEGRAIISYNKEKHEIVWNLGKQPSEAKGKVTLVVEVLESATPVGYVDNTAYVQINGDPEQQTETIENPTPHEEKTEKTPGNGVMVAIGDSITYLINWQNYRTYDATVIIIDTLDPGVDFVEADFIKDDKNLDVDFVEKTGENCKYYAEKSTIKVESKDGTFESIIPAHTVVWVLEDRLANEKGTVTLTVKVNKNAKVENSYNEDASAFKEPGTDKDYKVINQARVKVGNDPFIKTQLMENPVPEKTETEVSHADDFSIPETIVLESKVGEENTYVGPLVFVGDVITYKIHWTNGHDKPANVVVTDELDPGVDFVGAYLDGDVNNVADYDAVHRIVTWTLNDQDAGATGVVVLKVQVNGKATKVGVVENQAQVAVGAYPAVKTETIENPTPHEEKTETTPGEGMQVMPGDEIEYIIKWHNYHTDPATVTITDKLDPGVDFLFAFALEDTNKKLEAISPKEPEEGTNPVYPVEPGEEKQTDVSTDETEKNGSASVGTEEPGEENQPDILANEQGGTLVADSDNKEVNEQLTKEENSESPDNLTNGLEESPAGSENVDTEADKQEESDTEESLAGLEEDTEVDRQEESDTEESPAESEEDTETATSEESKIEYTDENGNKIIIEYDKETHTVKWTLESRAANSEATVTLKVRVNEDAEKLWNYDNQDEKPSETEHDYRILNQAGVQVGDDPEIKTRVIENPTKPSKTETEINDVDVSRELVADENGYVGPDVKVGDKITYKITWQNNASDEEGKPVPAIITIIDVLDGGVDFADASECGSYDPTTHTVTWDLGEKAERTEGYVTLTVCVNENALESGTVENEATVKVGNNPQQTDKVINRVKEVGNLQVTKTVTGTAGDTNKEWHFSVKLSDSSINGEYGGMTFVNGVAEFTLKSGGNKTATGLPVGTTYTVTETEANQDGYTTSVTGESGTITKDTTAVAAFVNSKDTSAPEPEFGNLQVTKTVTGTAGDTNKEWHFSVKLSDSSINGEYGGMTFVNGVAEFTLKSGGNKTATGLPTGTTYTVTETEANQDGYTTSVTGESGTITKDTTAIVGFVNSKDTSAPEPKFGNLQVTKKVTGTAGDVNKDWHFRVELTDQTVSGMYGAMYFMNGVAEFTLRHNESRTATGLPAGIIYTVTEAEANQNDYSTFIQNGIGVIPEGSTASATFENNKEIRPIPRLGNLQVKKTVTGNAGDVNKDWNFRVELSDTDINGEYGDMYFTNGVAAFTLKHGESKTATGLPAEISYTVTEAEANQDDYTTSVQGGNGVIPEDGTASAAFENSKETPKQKYGNLQVSKTVEGEDGDRNKDWNFRVELSDRTISGMYGAMYFTNGVAEFTLKHGESKTATGLPAEISYMVTEAEANQDNYTTSVQGGNGVIPEDGTASAAFENSKETPEQKYGNLQVSKTVKGDDGDRNKDWNFRVALSDTEINGEYGDMYFTNGVAVFTLKHGESKTATGLPDGIGYVVTEEEANKDNYETSVQGSAEGTIVAEETAVVAYTNTATETEEEPTPTVTPEPTPTPSEVTPTPTPIPERLTELPDPNDPDSPDTVTIWDDDTPLTYIKVWDPEKEEWVYIPEDENPLGPTNPKTGDDSNTLLWFVLCIVALVGTGVLVITDYRRKQKNRTK